MSLNVGVCMTQSSSFYFPCSTASSQNHIPYLHTHTPPPPPPPPPSPPTPPQAEAPQPQVVQLLDAGGRGNARAVPQSGSLFHLQRWTPPLSADRCIVSTHHHACQRFSLSSSLSPSPFISTFHPLPLSLFLSLSLPASPL